MQLKTFSSTKELVRALTPEFQGRKITIKDVLADQNMKNLNASVSGMLPDYQIMFEPECRACLEAAGYTYLPRLGSSVFVDFNDFLEGAVRDAYPQPRDLEKCRAVLGNKIAKVLIELDDGALVTIALAQGCRCGIFAYLDAPDGGYKLASLGADGAQGSAYIIAPDSGAVPSYLIIQSGIATSTNFSMAEIWEGHGIIEKPVHRIGLDRFNFAGDGCSLDRTVLSFIYKLEAGEAPGPDYEPKSYPSFFSIGLMLGGFDIMNTSVFYVDVARGGETTRYLLDKGLNPLLFDSAGWKGQ